MWRAAVVAAWIAWPGVTWPAIKARIAKEFPNVKPISTAELAKAIASHSDNIETVGVVPFRDSKSTTMGAPWWLTSSFSTYFEPVKQKAHIGVLSVANWDEAGTKHGLNPSVVIYDEFAQAAPALSTTCSTPRWARATSRC